MIRKKMLVIPGGFVPFNETVTLMTYSRLKHLDLDMDVLAFKGKEDAGIKAELEKDPDFAKFQIEYFADYGDAIAIDHPLRLFKSLFIMKRYIDRAVKKFEDGHYDYLYTSSVPGVVNLCGQAIKQKHPEITWIASFSDPIKNSPFKDPPDLKLRSIFYRIAFKTGAFIYYNDAYEKAAIAHADKFIFICEEQREFTLSLYSNKNDLMARSLIMPLTYIPEWTMYKELVDCRRPKNSPKIASHLGRLYGLRNATAFIEALNELNQEMPTLKDRIVFHQYSVIQPTDVHLIKKYGLEELFVLHDKVSRNEVNEILNNSDILVLFDTLMPGAPVQPYLPYKSIEYLLTKKPILAVCGANSPSYRLFKKFGYTTVGCEIDVIKRNILQLLEDTGEYEYSLSALDCVNYSIFDEPQG